jgi:hypothetical protein
LFCIYCLLSFSNCFDNFQSVEWILMGFQNFLFYQHRQMKIEMRVDCSCCNSEGEMVFPNLLTLWRLRVQQIGKSYLWPSLPIMCNKLAFSSACRELVDRHLTFSRKKVALWKYPRESFEKGQTHLDVQGLWHRQPLGALSGETLDFISANWLYFPYHSLTRPKVTHVECSSFHCNQNIVPEMHSAR